jgi:hypothetical protein
VTAPASSPRFVTGGPERPPKTSLT